MVFQLLLYAIAISPVLAIDADQNPIATTEQHFLRRGSAKVTLLSQEGERYEVPRSVAVMSELVKSITEDNDDDAHEIPLPNVKSTVLSKVIEFCRHHENNPMKKIEKVHTLYISSILDSVFNVVGYVAIDECQHA